MLIDTHTHINFHEFRDDWEDVTKRALENETWMVNVATKYSTSQRAIEIADRYDEGVYAAVGIHPIHLIEDIMEESVIESEEYAFVTKGEKFDYEKFKKLALSSPKVVAVGETGLDLYRTEKHDPAKVFAIQEEAFRQSIRLANELNLAVIVHGRGAPDDPYAIYNDIIRILKEERAERGVVHCYGGTPEQALQLVEIGFNVGVTGIVTFKNAKMLQNTVRMVPLEHLVVETDAPYLAPEPYRGKRNEPMYVQYVAAKIAELRGLSFEKVAEETTINARRMYII